MQNVDLVTRKEVAALLNPDNFENFIDNYSGNHSKSGLKMTLTSYIIIVTLLMLFSTLFLLNIYLIANTQNKILKQLNYWFY